MRVRIIIKFKGIFEDFLKEFVNYFYVLNHGRVCGYQKKSKKKNKKNKKYEIWCALLFVMYFSTFPRVFELSSGISQYC